MSLPSPVDPLLTHWKPRSFSTNFRARVPVGGMQRQNACKLRARLAGGIQEHGNAKMRWEQRKAAHCIHQSLTMTFCCFCIAGGRQGAPCAASSHLQGVSSRAALEGCVVPRRQQSVLK